MMWGMSLQISTARKGAPRILNPKDTKFVVWLFTIDQHQNR
jgi:hypothetical protein